MLTFQQNKTNNINNIVQKIKAKYLFNNDSLNNKMTLKNKELSELEKKLNYYKNKLFSSTSSIDKYINLKIEPKNINLNSNTDNSYNINSNINTENSNNDNIINEKSFSFKNSIKNSNANNPQNINILKESQISQSKLSHNLGEETINFSLSEDESGLSGYFKFKASQLEDKDKEYNYNDVLPIINKVSKLKEIKEEDDNEKIIANNIVNNIVNNAEDNNEDEKYKNIMNKFKEEDKDNDILYNQINNQSLNSSKNEKPKLIRKNSSDKDKKRNANKIISFEEFLSKENSNE